MQNHLIFGIVYFQTFMLSHFVLNITRFINLAYSYISFIGIYVIYMFIYLYIYRFLFCQAFLPFSYYYYYHCHFATTVYVVLC